MSDNRYRMAWSPPWGSYDGDDELERSRLPADIVRKIKQFGSIGACCDGNPLDWQVAFEFPECEQCGRPLAPERESDLCIDCAMRRWRDEYHPRTAS